MYTIVKISNGSAPLNKIAAMPIYRKHFKVFFSRTKKALRLILVYSIGDSKSSEFVQMILG